MKKLLFFLLLTTAVVGRAQTSLDLLPVGTEAILNLDYVTWLSHI